MSIRVYATTDQNLGLRAVARHARRVEQLGYDGLFVPEGVHDGLLAAHAALQATERLRVATAVVVAFPRSPMVVAQAAWDLQALSAGRFELGLGTQVRGNIVKRYSTTWVAPVARMHDYIDSLRAIWHVFQTGDRLDYGGEHYRFSRLQPFFNPGPIEHPDIPVLIGAVGPKMTRLAGGLADGLITHPTNCGPRFLDEIVQPLLSEGTGTGRTRAGAVEVVASPLIATGADRTMVGKERNRVRELLAFLYSTPSYWPTLELIGHGELGPRLRDLTRQGKWKRMAALLPEDLLDAVVPCGPYDEIGGTLRRWYGGRAAGVTFPVPPPEQEERFAEVLETLRA